MAVGSNIVANLLGKMWSMAMSLAFVPIYLRFLGVEAYGVIGVIMSLQAALAVLDLGLGMTITRDLAALSGRRDKAQEMRDLLRTMEIAYWAVGLAIGASLWLASPFIAERWLQTKAISSGELRTVFSIAAALILFQWPSSIYSGALTGMQRLVALNWLQTLALTFRNGGAALALAFFSPSLQCYLAWQALSALLQTLALRQAAWRALPQAPRPERFSFPAILERWRFAASVSGIYVLTTVITQTDKLLLSKTATMETFGYYTLALAVSNGLYLVANSINSAIFPKLSQLASATDRSGLTQFYHAANQLMAGALLPISATLIFFPEEVIRVWTGNSLFVKEAAPLVILLVIGTCLNGLMYAPFSLQMAHGRTRLIYKAALVATFVWGPFMAFAVLHYGTRGAALAWIILNLFYVFVLNPFLHKETLSGEMRFWYLRDMLPPLAASMVAALLFRLAPVPEGRIQSGLFLLLVLLTTQTVGALASGEIRRRVADVVRTRFQSARSLAARQKAESRRLS